MSPQRDPITFELFKNAIFSISDEMALTVLRTTYSGVTVTSPWSKSAWNSFVRSSPFWMWLLRGPR